jgi:transposase-like protein
MLAAGRSWEGPFFVERIRHSVEQIIHKLREAEVLFGQGMKVSEATRHVGVAAQTYYQWRKGYSELCGGGGRAS